jgi:pyruvate-formate lyase-activating enzyme
MNIVASSMCEKDRDGGEIVFLVICMLECDVCSSYEISDIVDSEPAWPGSVEDGVVPISHSETEKHFITSMNSLVRRKSSSITKNVIFRDPCIVSLL